MFVLTEQNKRRRAPGLLTQCKKGRVPVYIDGAAALKSPRSIDIPWIPCLWLVGCFVSMVRRKEGGKGNRKLIYLNKVKFEGY